MYLLKQFLSDKEIECRVSRPPTKIGDLLFHGENDNIGFWHGEAMPE